MTSQLILGNGRGLALASDSAATSRTGQERRTWEDATKIYPLRQPHRVAVLQAGGVNLLGMPVSVLVNQWQETLGEGRMPLEGYRDSFLSWLGHNLGKWTTQDAMDDKAYDALKNELKRLRRGNLYVLREGVEEGLTGGVEKLLTTVPDEEHHDATLRAIQERSEYYLAFAPVFDPALPPMADGLFSRLGSRSQEDSWTPDSLIASGFEGLPRSEQIDRALHELFRLMVGRNYSITGLSTIELTFAGYGSSELIPSVASVEIEGALENHIARSCESERKAVALLDAAGFALYKPVAQYETIEMIIFGHNRELLQAAIGDVVGPSPVLSSDRAKVEGDPEVDAEDAPDPDLVEETTERDAMDEWTKAQRLGKEVVERADTLSDTHHYWKFMRTIAGLEMTSLADTTRSLVAVEALSKTLLGELPTVGGHIDVATITLTDGFTWVKSDLVEITATR